jgi:uncharacterized protein (PEP-CTERM system associated)
VVLSLSGMPSAWAAETQFTPIISISETYTDNVELAPPGLEKADWVTEMRGGFTFAGVGQRARANIRYTPSLFTFARQNKTDLRHDMSSSAEVELVEDHFFINGSAAAYETFTGSDQDISISDRNISEDRIQVFGYSVTPELRNRFGSTATAILQYAFQRVENEQPKDPSSSGLADSSNNSVTLAVRSGEDFQRLRWNVTSGWRKENRSGVAANVTDKSVNANGSYNVNRTVALTAGAGYRDYSYGSGGSSGLSGMTWDMGVRLTPSRRANLSVSYGKDRRNKHWTVSGSYEPGARTQAQVSYNESYQTSQNLQLGELPSVDQPSTPGIGGAFDFFGRNEVPGGRLTDQVFLQKRFSISLRHTFGHTTALVSASTEDRTYDGGTNEKVRRGTARLTHRFNGRVSVTASGTYLNRDELSGREDDIYFGSVYLSRVLVGNASVFVSYDYTRRDSNIFLFDMRENAYTAGLTASF